MSEREGRKDTFLTVGGHVVADYCAVASSLRNDRLRRIVCCVHVYVGQVSQQYITP